MDRVLVTGASGFIGKAVIEELLNINKYEIFAVTTDKKRLNGYSGLINIEEVNLLSEEETELLIKRVKPNKTIHLAWQLDGNDAFQKSGANIEWVRASLFLVKNIIANNGEKIIFAGSSSEYNFSEFPLKEDDNMPCLNLYGKCKKAVTDICIDYCMSNGVDFTAARYFSVYGRYDNRESRAIPEAIKSFIKNKEFLCKSPLNKWDYIYIDDAARATVKLLESKLTGIINIGSGKPRDMKTVFETIAEIMNKKELLCCGENMKELSLFSDNSRMVNELGYKCEVDLNEGLSRTVEWFKNTDFSY